MHFLDMYADDLSIFLEYKKGNPYENKEMLSVFSKPWA